MSADHHVFHYSEVSTARSRRYHQCGRGTVVDQEALEEELQNGRLYAGLDVFEKEPLPAESVLWDSPRAVITPHVAGDTSLPHTVDRIVDLFLEDFENYCTGRPLLRQVDRLIGY